MRHGFDPSDDRRLEIGLRVLAVTNGIEAVWDRARFEWFAVARREGRTKLALVGVGRLVQVHVHQEVDVELVDPERDVTVVLARSVWTADAGGIAVAPTPVDVAPWADLEEVDFIGGAMREALPPGFHRSLRMRTSLRPEPVIWLRSRLDGLTGGRPFTADQRFAGLADMATVAATRLRAAATGVSPAEADLGMHLVNADLTLHLSRAPVGEWVGFVDGWVEVSGGAGAATVRILADLGPVGRSTHTVVASGR